jgi:chorismate mutase
VSPLFGIRGAVQPAADTPEEIDRSTRDLLAEMASRNGVEPDRVVAIWFTQTPDLTAAHAPASARALGWTRVPLLGAQEAPVADQLPRVVRALMIAELDGEPGSARHVYLGATRALREDLNDGDSE